MITLSLSPSGEITAFCEALSPEERGYYIDLPQDDPQALQRTLAQALLLRNARKAKVSGETPDPAIGALVTAWLVANPPVAAQPKISPLAKPTLDLSSLKTGLAKVDMAALKKEWEKK